MMRNIVILGFMGTGKTSVARALARKLNARYISTDEMIEKKAGEKIKDIFAKKGEGYFRKLEKEAILGTSSERGVVIDAGGGACIDPENVKNFQKNGILICLWADPEIILERTKLSGARPLLATQKPDENIKKLLSERKKFYERAEHHINTSRLSVARVVSEIENIIKNA